jgi:Tfp pilus assembly protein PilO
MERIRQFLRRLRWLDLRSTLVPVGAVLLGILVLNLLFYVFLTRPRLEMAAGSRASFQRLNQRLVEEREAEDAIRRRVSLARCTAYDLTKFRDDVLSSKVARMTVVMKSLRDLARTFRMDPENIQYQMKEMPDSGLMTLGVSFPLHGSYEDLRQFLHHIEESEHFLLIDGVGLRGTQEGGAQLDLNIRLSTYFAAERVPEEEQDPGAGRSGRSRSRRRT